MFNVSPSLMDEEGSPVIVTLIHQPENPEYGIYRIDNGIFQPPTGMGCGE